MFKWFANLFAESRPLVTHVDIPEPVTPIPSLPQGARQRAEMREQQRWNWLTDPCPGDYPVWKEPEQTLTTDQLRMIRLPEGFFPDENECSSSSALEELQGWALSAHEESEQTLVVPAYTRLQQRQRWS